MKRVAILRDLFWIFLFPLSVLWAGFTHIRRKFVRPIYQPLIPVLCIGNIHSGGSGKTPLVAAVAERFPGVAILSRGYRGRSESGGSWVNKESLDGPREFGDEPWMLSQLTGSPVLVGKDRVRSVQEVEKNSKFVGAILDDGFQHLRLGRKLDLIAIDVERKLEDAYCLPLGELREPLSALGRAGGVVLTGVENKEREIIWRGFLSSRFPRVPVFSGKLSLKNWSLDPSTSVFGFCGIAGPNRFQNLLESHACVKGFRSFSDHHVYGQDDLEGILSAARSLQAVCVTTDKDYFKLRGRFEERGESLLSLRIGYELSEDFWYFLKNRWISK